MLNNILDELKLNALVITDPYNMRHVSGFRGGEGALYISATQKVLITEFPFIPSRLEKKVISQSSRRTVGRQPSDHFEGVHGERNCER